MGVEACVKQKGGPAELVQGAAVAVLCAQRPKQLSELLAPKFPSERSKQMWTSNGVYLNLTSEAIYFKQIAILQKAWA